MMKGNISIRLKLLISFGIVILLSVPVSIYTIHTLYQVKHDVVSLQSAPDTLSQNVKPPDKVVNSWWIALSLRSAIFLIAIIASLVFISMITRPIIRLTDFVRRINQDNLDQRVPVTSRDEIGELTEAINNMLDLLHQSQARLIETSRTAALAEVSTSVLHNVGNVLNSINVSTSVINQHLNDSRHEKLRQLSILMEQKKNELNDYLAHNEQGRLILPYLAKLSDQLKEDNEAIKDELARLIANLQHANNIIAMQQDYGRSRAQIEKICMAELIDTTCMMSSNKIKQADILILREFSELPLVYSVKSKIQQILINLLKNSIDSLEQSNVADKKIIIRLNMQGQKIQIAVIDNGLGIKEENIKKIFSFGFTTKKEGHGYGIHNSALLANELGGELRVLSKGLHEGATFILEIPCQQKLAGQEEETEIEEKV